MSGKKGAARGAGSSTTSSATVSGMRNTSQILASLSGLSVPGFLTKAYELFSLPEHQDFCGWGDRGETVIIHKIEPFSREILPKYFKHSNLASFVRQLNMYDFHKTVADPGHMEFVHPYFQANHPELLVMIRRKAHAKSAPEQKQPVVQGRFANKRPGGSKNSHHRGLQDDENDDEENDQLDDEVMLPTHGGADADDLLLVGAEGAGGGELLLGLSARVGSFSNSDPGQSDESGMLHRVPLETDAVLKDMVYQKNLRVEFESRLRDLERQQARLLKENNGLRRIITDSKAKQEVTQERMNKILTTLYQLFSGSGGYQLRAGSDGNVTLGVRDALESDRSDPDGSNPIPLISSLGENKFMEIVGYLELESPLGPKVSVATNASKFSSDGTALQRMHSFETAAASIEPATLIVPSNSTTPRPGAPLGRLTSLDWPTYATVPSGSQEQQQQKKTKTGYGSDVETSTKRGVGVAEILGPNCADDTKRQRLALAMRPADTLTANVNAVSALVNLSSPRTQGGRPPLPNGKPSGKSFQAAAESKFDETAALLDASHNNTISRLDSLEQTLNDLLTNGIGGSPTS